MNYRHAYHAGNFADVLKHAGLVSILLHLRKKPKPFAVIDTHAGRGLYDLRGDEAARTGEAARGILRLLNQGPLPENLEPYGEIVRGFGPDRYPGSPLIAARCLRPGDRLVAIEKHPEEYAALAKALAGEWGAAAQLGDGYRMLAKLMPPPERRAVVLIDPPFEAEDEFEAAIRALIGAHRRFATGIFLLWYPVKARARVQAACGEMLNGGIVDLLRVELAIGDAGAGREGTPRLNETGLFVVNAPYGFAGEMEAVCAFLARTLGESGAAARVERLAGEA